MSYFSTAITLALKDAGWTQQELATKAGMSPATINRAARGTIPLGAKAAESIARALPETHRGAVLAAWLQDQLPIDLERLVEINPVTAALQETLPTRELPPNLDPELRELILWVAEQGQRHSAVKDSLRSFRAAVQWVPRGTSSQDPRQ